jgi:serine/threonine protein kinase
MAVCLSLLSQGCAHRHQAAALQDWKLFLVQEFCEAGSLRAAIDRRIFLTPDCKTKIVRALCCLLPASCMQILDHNMVLLWLRTSTCLVSLRSSPTLACAN